MDSNTGLALLGFALVFCTAIGFWTSMVAYHRSGSRFTAVVIFVISYAFWPAAIVLANVLRRPGGWFADPWSEAPYRWIEQQGAAPARWTDPARSPA